MRGGHKGRGGEGLECNTFRMLVDHGEYEMGRGHRGEWGNGMKMCKGTIYCKLVSGRESFRML